MIRSTSGSDESGSAVASATQSPNASPRAESVQVEGHKLHHHLDRVVPFLAGERIFPLYVELSPVGSCNHRCTFCAYDYIGYPDRQLETEATTRLLGEMGRLGVKSVLWAGEGEPLLHREMDRLVTAARSAGLDNGMFSNAAALTEKKARAILPHLTFLRVSFNGGDAETYAAVHQTRENQFDRVLANLERAVALRESEGWSVTLGLQIVVLPENLHTVEPLARIASGLGVDYLAIKPFVQHPDQQNRVWPESFRLEEIDGVATAAEQHGRPGFDVKVRRQSFVSYQERNYRSCRALPFFAFILSDGNVYTCGPYYGNEEHCYGNVYEQSFEQIWQSERARRIQEHAACSLDVSQCMPNCRPDAANRFLSELANPPAHVNFI